MNDYSYTSLAITPSELKKHIADGLISFVPNPPVSLKNLRKGCWKWGQKKGYEQKQTGAQLNTQDP